MYRKNTTGQTIGFAAINASTGATMTGTTGFAAFRVVDGGSQVSATGTVTDKTNGQYSFALSQADTNGNDVSILFTMTGMVAVEKTFVTTVCDPTNATNFGIADIDTNIGSRSTYSGGAVASVTAPVTLAASQPDYAPALAGTAPSWYTDPWAVTVPGSYGAGTAGNTLGAIPSVLAGVGSTVSTIATLATGAVAATAAAVWNADLTGFTTPNTAGNVVYGNLAAPNVASSVTSEGFGLMAGDALTEADLENWTVVILTATTGAGQVATIASSDTETGFQTVASWPLGEPTGAVTYFLQTPDASGGGSSGPTAVQIREEIDSNSTQLEALRTGVVVTTNDDKEGYALSSTGLDIIATTPASFGEAPNFRQMVVASWRRWYRKFAATTDGTLTGYADDGTTALTTQTIPAPVANQTQGPSA